MDVVVSDARHAPISQEGGYAGIHMPSGPFNPVHTGTRYMVAIDLSLDDIGKYDPGTGVLLQ